MAKAGLIMEEDTRIVYKLLKSQLISLNRERTEKKAQLIFNQELGMAQKQQQLLLEQQLIQAKIQAGIHGTEIMHEQSDMYASPNHYLTSQISGSGTPSQSYPPGPQQPLMQNNQQHWIDQQHQFLQAQQNVLLQQQLQQQLSVTDNNHFQQLLHQNLIQQARMSPSLLNDDPMLNPQQQLLLEQTIPQQMLLDQNIPQQIAQNVILKNQQQFINQQSLMTEQLLQQELQNQRFIVQQQQAMEQQLSAASEEIPQQIDPNNQMHQLQNVLTHIIQTQDNTLMNKNVDEIDDRHIQQTVPTTMDSSILKQSTIHPGSSIGYGSLDSPCVSQQKLPILALQLSSQKQLQQQALVHQQLLAQQELLQQQGHLQQLNNFQQQIAQQELQLQAQQQYLDRKNMSWLSNQNSYGKPQQNLVFDQSQNNVPLMNTLELQQLAQQQQQIIHQQQQLLQQQQQLHQQTTFPLQNSINANQNYIPSMDYQQQQQLLNIAYSDQQQQLVQNSKVEDINNQIMPQQIIDNQVPQMSQTSIKSKPDSLSSSIEHSLSRTSSHEGNAIENLPLPASEELDGTPNHNNDYKEQFMTPMAEMPEELAKNVVEQPIAPPVEGMYIYALNVVLTLSIIYVIFCRKTEN